MTKYVCLKQDTKDFRYALIASNVYSSTNKSCIGSKVNIIFLIAYFLIRKGVQLAYCSLLRGFIINVMFNEFNIYRFNISGARNITLLSLSRKDLNTFFDLIL